jgi:quinol monooxygenase YgiN
MWRASMISSITRAFHTSPSWDASTFLAYQVFADAAAFDAHMQTEWYAEFFEHAGPMMDGKPSLRRFKRSVANAK